MMNQINAINNKNITHAGCVILTLPVVLVVFKIGSSDRCKIFGLNTIDFKIQLKIIKIIVINKWHSFLIILVVLDSNL